MLKKRERGKRMIIFQASPIRKWVGGTSSYTDLASLRIVLTSLYLADWGFSLYITYLHLSSLRSFMTFYKYCLEIPADFHTLTYTFPHYGCEFPGGQFFYVWNSSEFPSAFTWLVVLKIMLGPWDVTVCREDVEFCQPVKYVWFFFFFFFFRSFHTLLILCGLHLTEFIFNRTTHSLYHLLWLGLF